MVLMRTSWQARGYRYVMGAAGARLPVMLAIEVARQRAARIQRSVGHDCLLLRHISVLTAVTVLQLVRGGSIVRSTGGRRPAAGCGPRALSVS